MRKKYKPLQKIQIKILFVFVFLSILNSNVFGFNFEETPEPQTRLSNELNFDPLLAAPIFIWVPVPVAASMKSATPDQIATAACDPSRQVKVEVAKSDKQKKDPESRSWVPIAGYNSTYEFFGGGGYFFSEDKYEFAVYGILTTSSAVQLNANFANSISKDWSYSVRHELDHGFEPYYGEGNNTRVEDRVDFVHWKLLSRWNLDYHITPSLSVGPALDMRFRRNQFYSDPGLEAVPTQEDAIGFGMVQQFDLRNSADDASFGWYESLTVLAVPSLFVEDYMPTFGFVNLNMRFFQQMIRDVVVAMQFNVGTIIGQPSYTYEPRLGGTHLLRGYYENRFRGNQYYVQQTEFRYPIWRFISGVAFLEFGEATSGCFGTPNVSSGLGLRVGLPPDFIKKIRLDIGFGKDQFGIFVDFGHSF